MGKLLFAITIFCISLIITVGNVESVSADFVKFDQLDHIILAHSDIISFVDDAPFESLPITVYLSSTLEPNKPFTLTDVIDTSQSQKVYRKTVMFSTTCALPCSNNELNILSTPDETLTLTRNVASDTVTTKGVGPTNPFPPYGNNVAPLSTDAAVCGQGNDEEVRLNNPTKGDGICDSWETGGNLLINTLGGTWSPQPNSILQKSGPANNKLDIYVEIDYIQGHRPNLESLWNVINGFEVMGINLHIQLDDEGRTGILIPHSPTTRWPGSDSNKGFQQISATHFGTCLERSTAGNCEVPDTSWSTNWKRKAQVFHYGLFAHGPTTGSATGIGEVGGNDFMITLGVLNNVNELVPPSYIEGTLMHELGHNLNLSHGGAYNDLKNCKPTHMSVMSHSRQFTDLVPPRNLEYSKSVVIMENGGTLSESSSLSETNGIGPYYDTTEEITWGTGSTNNYLPPVNRATVGSTQVDWNQDTQYTTSNSQFLNTIYTASGRVICPLSPQNEQLPGYDDQTNLVYHMRQDGDWLNGVSVSGITVPAPFCFSPSTIVNWYNAQNPSPPIPLATFFNMFPTCEGGVSVSDPVILDDFTNNLNDANLPEVDIARILAVSALNQTSSELTPDDIISMRLARVDSIMDYLNKMPDGDFYQGHSNGTLTYHQDGMLIFESLIKATKIDIEKHRLLDAQDKLKTLYMNYQKYIKNPTKLDALKKGTADIYLAINKVVLGPPMVTKLISPPKPVSDIGSLVLSQEFHKILPELVDIDGKIIEENLNVDFIKDGKLFSKEWGVIMVDDKVIHHDVTYWKPYFLQNKNHLGLNPIDVKCNDSFERIFKPTVKSDDKTAICVKPATSAKLLSLEHTRYSLEP